MKWNQRIKKTIISMTALAVTMLALPMHAYAMEDGAYLVKRTVSYNNPDTGDNPGGSSNVALGQSMAESVLDEDVLVEQVNGKTYVTFGLGLASNISNIRIQVKASNGQYKQVAATKTGSCTRDGDRCDHYRIELSTTDTYISPILFIGPMGRDVQFYFKLNMNTATPGTGSYNSQMIPKETQAPVETVFPTKAPVVATAAPTKAPVVATAAPTKAPVVETVAPTFVPTTAPVEQPTITVEPITETLDQDSTTPGQEIDSESSNIEEEETADEEERVEEESEQEVEGLTLYEVEDSNTDEETKEMEKNSSNTGILIAAIVLVVAVVAAAVTVVIRKKKRT